MMLACHSSINLPSSANSISESMRFPRTVTHAGGGIFTLGVTMKTHGKTNTLEYTTWDQIKARCNNPKHERFKYYGGRGIKVCERWLTSFENFLADMGTRPTPSHSIERKDGYLMTYAEKPFDNQGLLEEDKPVKEI